MLIFPDDTLSKAITRGDLAAVRGFVERGDIRLKGTRNPDPHSLFEPEDGTGSEASFLTIACKVGHVEVVRYLLEVGNYREHYSRYAPEAFAAINYGRLEVFRLLCESGLDPDSPEYSKHGESVTDLAVREKRVEFLRLLLPLNPILSVDYDNEETTDEECESGNFPSTLELAARAGDVELAELLLEAGFSLGEQTADYYRGKAGQNAPKYQQRLKQQSKQSADEQEQRQRKAEEDAKNVGAQDFWACIFLILFSIALCWIFWRVFLWAEWLGVIALLLLCGWGLARLLKSL